MVWWFGLSLYLSLPLQLTTGLVVNSFIITNPTLAGERMLLIPKVSSVGTNKNSKIIKCRKP